MSATSVLLVLGEPPRWGPRKPPRPSLLLWLLPVSRCLGRQIAITFRRVSSFCFSLSHGLSQTNPRRRPVNRDEAPPLLPVGEQRTGELGRGSWRPSRCAMDTAWKGGTGAPAGCYLVLLPVQGKGQGALPLHVTREVDPDPPWRSEFIASGSPC